MKERPLVLFTLLSQAAVGIFSATILLHLLYAFLPQSSQGENLSIVVLTMILLLLSFMFASAGLFISLAHLGSPLRAWRAVRNLAHSWLSREIAFGLLFTFFEGLALLAYLFPSALAATLVTSQVCALLSGLAFIYSMARVYMQRTIPIWDSAFPFRLFFLTTLNFGLLITAFLSALILPITHPLSQAFFYIFSLSAAGFTVGQILNLHQQRQRAHPDKPLQPGQQKPKQPSNASYNLVFTSLVLAALIVLLPRWQPDWLRLWLLLSLCLVVIGETMSRQIFYASYRRTGL